MKFEIYSSESQTWIPMAKQDETEDKVELIDFGSDQTLFYSEKQYDTFINPHVAKEIKAMLKEIFEKEKIESKTFSLDGETSSDLYRLINIDEEEGTQRSCPRCGKSFS